MQITITLSVLYDDRLGRADDCHRVCWGDGSQICGGSLAFSVYEITGKFIIFSRSEVFFSLLKVYCKFLYAHSTITQNTNGKLSYIKFLQTFEIIE